MGDDAVIACLVTCITTGTGGMIREVTAQAFEEWQKKTSGQRQVWPDREGYTGGVARDTSRSSSQSPSAAPVVAPNVTAAPVPAPPQVQNSGQSPLANIPTRRRGAASP